MKFSAADRLLLILGLFFLGANCFAANNTPLVSGNGLGFAVFSRFARMLSMVSIASKSTSSNTTKYFVFLMVDAFLGRSLLG